jgi:hypothetical protein
MRIHKIYIAIGLVFAFSLFFELAAHADEANQETIFTFNEPVQIPGAVLPAGTYRFQLLDPDSQKDIVQIFNAERTALFATVQTIAAERLQPTGDTTITLAAPEAGGPNVLVKWFYPGRLIGHEFVYPKQVENRIAHSAHETFVGGQPISTGFAGGN